MAWGRHGTFHCIFGRYFAPNPLRAESPCDGLVFFARTARSRSAGPPWMLGAGREPRVWGIVGAMRSEGSTPRKRARARMHTQWKARGACTYPSGAMSGSREAGVVETGSSRPIPTPAALVHLSPDCTHKSQAMAQGAQGQQGNTAVLPPSNAAHPVGRRGGPRPTRPRPRKPSTLSHGPQSQIQHAPSDLAHGHGPGGWGKARKMLVPCAALEPQVHATAWAGEGH
jgi:hypothetical protein